MSLPFPPFQDKLFGTLRDKYKANVVLKPQPTYQTMLVIERDPSNRIEPSIQGLLSSYVNSPAVLDLQNSPLSVTSLQDLEGVTSTMFSPKIGLQILDGFLKGFLKGHGIQEPSFKPILRSMSGMAFSFESILLQKVGHSELIEAIQGTQLDVANSTSRFFIGEGASDLLLIDGILLTSSITIHFTSEHERLLMREIRELEEAVFRMQGDMELIREGPNQLKIKGPGIVPFALTFIHLRIDGNGNLIDEVLPEIEPVKEEEEIFDHVLLSRKGELVDIEESALAWP
ncbi:MAG: hypothetical protein AAF399_09320 [Bacteroidota bacterium]